MTELEEAELSKRIVLHRENRLLNAAIKIYREVCATCADRLASLLSGIKTCTLTNTRRG